MCVALLFAACASGSPHRSARDVDATVPASTTTTDPYAVPATIDIPYLNRVFAALEKINGDATRLIVAHRAITPDAAKLLSAIYTDDEFKAQAEDWNNLIDGGLHTFRPQPGDRKTTVTEVLVQRPDCVSVRVERDYTAVVVKPEPVVSRVSLSRHAPSGINPTPWIISAQLKSGDLPCA